MHGTMVMFGLFISSLMSLLGNSGIVKNSVFIGAPLILCLLQLILMLSFYRYEVQKKPNDSAIKYTELRKDITSKLYSIFKNYEYKPTMLISMALGCTYVFCGPPIMEFFLSQYVSSFFIVNPTMTWKSKAIYCSGIYVVGLILTVCSSHLVESNLINSVGKKKIAAN